MDRYHTLLFVAEHALHGHGLKSRGPEIMRAKGGKTRKETACETKSYREGALTPGPPPGPMSGIPGPKNEAFMLYDTGRP